VTPQIASWLLFGYWMVAAVVAGFSLAFWVGLWIFFRYAEVSKMEAGKWWF